MTSLAAMLTLLALVLLVGAALVFNLLIWRRNAAENAFAAIDVYLQMRYDLIPALVETVKGYARHERETLEALMALRAQAIGRQRDSDRSVCLNNEIGAAMRQVLALAEAYPELKAAEQFQKLMRSLNEVEERLSAARRAFNASVLDYNNSVEQFPTHLVAQALGFRRRAFLEAQGSARAPVPVGLGG
jgi:LemA protein